MANYIQAFLRDLHRVRSCDSDTKHYILQIDAAHRKVILSHTGIDIVFDLSTLDGCLMLDDALWEVMPGNGMPDTKAEWKVYNAVGAYLSYCQQTLGVEE